MDLAIYDKIMNEDIGYPLTWIGNYFYNTGKFTVKGSPYSAENNDKDYKLHKWLKFCEEKKTITPLWCLVIAAEYGFLVPRVGKKHNGIIDNLCCGRSSFKQRFFDDVFTEMLKK